MLDNDTTFDSEEGLPPENELNYFKLIIGLRFINETFTGVRRVAASDMKSDVHCSVSRMLMSLPRDD